MQLGGGYVDVVDGVCRARWGDIVDMVLQPNVDTMLGIGELLIKDITFKF